MRQESSPLAPHTIARGSRSRQRRRPQPSRWPPPRPSEGVEAPTVPHPTLPRITALPATASGFIPVVDLDATVAALAPRLIAYALARTGSRPTAEDIAQEALTALVRRWRQGGPPDSPDAYAFAIARRRAFRAVAGRALLSPLDGLRATADEGADVERLHADRRELAAVRAALRALPRRDREALLLRAIGDLPVEAIAQVLHTTAAAVKMRISRARRRLAALLPEHTHGR